MHSPWFTECYNQFCLVVANCNHSKDYEYYKANIKWNGYEKVSSCWCIYSFGKYGMH
ncbi:hypothetical protein PSECIP111951_00267 [Pseudoalteromonas holothuriae]|uniref:Uncharacterized protein n=1 Tax=Pseudoalteromonas holothuriae TaxID=2963714 RepID=A0A9W4QZQ5_9GAMM|nr:hypothetical protein PSECIP111951_00267 [Pseudoalteromonas sp. CIP111951]CAH9061457.1 hypothetical protein PSECIP111854_02815 [Pseudoalteromonas sp. CIP111854]